jgi:hypothetical protein
MEKSLNRIGTLRLVPGEHWQNGNGLNIGGVMSGYHDRLNIRIHWNVAFGAL